MKELYLRICRRVFGRTVTEIIRSEQRDNPWLFIFAAVIAGVALAWKYDRKTVIGCVVSVFIGILIGHFWF